ncbi:MAG: hypothetical protein ACOYO2_11530, partial [Mycobacterium sp.]
MNTGESVNRLLLGACALAVAVAATGGCTRTVATGPEVVSVTPSEASSAPTTTQEQTITGGNGGQGGNGG